MKTRRKKQTKRVLAGTLAALMTVSAVPVSNSVVHAEESQDRSELKLKYSSAAPDSYAGWENGLFRSETVESGQVYLAVCRQSVFS